MQQKLQGMFKSPKIALDKQTFIWKLSPLFIQALQIFHKDFLLRWLKLSSHPDSKQ